MKKIVLLGFSKDEEFSFARALIDTEASISLVLDHVVQPLKCVQSLDKTYEYSYGSTKLEIYGVCVVDAVYINQVKLNVRSMFYVARAREKMDVEAIVGLDLLARWLTVAGRKVVEALSA